MGLDFNHPTKSLLQQEQELLDSGEIENEDDLSRLYPNIIGNGHPDVCLCQECAPGEYEYYEEEEEEDDTSVIYVDPPFDNFGYTDEQLQQLQDSDPNQTPKNGYILYHNGINPEFIQDDHPF